MAIKYACLLKHQTHAQAQNSDVLEAAAAAACAAWLVQLHFATSSRLLVRPPSRFGTAAACVQVLAHCSERRLAVVSCRWPETRGSGHDRQQLHLWPQVLAHCSERRLAVVPQGGNSSLAGGAVPCFDEVVLSTAAMKAFHSFDEVRRVCCGTYAAVAAWLLLRFAGNLIAISCHHLGKRGGRLLLLLLLSHIRVLKAYAGVLIWACMRTGGKSSPPHM